MRALLIYTHVELQAIKNFIASYASSMSERVKFEIMSAANLSEAPNRQQHKVTLDVLSTILSDYHFRDGLEHSFNPSSGNMLTHKLEKIPEPMVAHGRKTPNQIKRVIKRYLEEIIKERIVEDLHFNPALNKLV